MRRTLRGSCSLINTQKSSYPLLPSPLLASGSPLSFAQSYSSSAKKPQEASEKKERNHSHAETKRKDTESKTEHTQSHVENKTFFEQRHEEFGRIKEKHPGMYNVYCVCVNVDKYIHTCVCERKHTHAHSVRCTTREHHDSCYVCVSEWSPYAHPPSPTTHSLSQFIGQYRSIESGSRITGDKVGECQHASLLGATLIAICLRAIRANQICLYSAPLFRLMYLSCDHV